MTGKLGTITRSDGSTQATYNGHPLYTYVSDSAPGQDKGNGLNLSGGVWHVVPVSGGAAAATHSSPSSSSGGGGGYSVLTDAGLLTAGVHLFREVHPAAGPQACEGEDGHGCGERVTAGGAGAVTADRAAGGGGGPAGGHRGDPS